MSRRWVELMSYLVQTLQIIRVFPVRITFLVQLKSFQTLFYTIPSRRQSLNLTRCHVNAQLSRTCGAKHGAITEVMCSSKQFSTKALRAGKWGELIAAEEMRRRRGSASAGFGSGDECRTENWTRWKEEREREWKGEDSERDRERDGLDALFQPRWSFIFLFLFFFSISLYGNSVEAGPDLNIKQNRQTGSNKHHKSDWGNSESKYVETLVSECPKIYRTFTGLLFVRDNVQLEHKCNI